MTRSMTQLSVFLIAFVMLQFVSLQHDIEHFSEITDISECHICLSNQSCHDLDDNISQTAPVAIYHSLLVARDIIATELNLLIQLSAIRAPPFLV